MRYRGLAPGPPRSPPPRGPGAGPERGASAALAVCCRGVHHLQGAVHGVSPPERLRERGLPAERHGLPGVPHGQASGARRTGPAAGRAGSPWRGPEGMGARSHSGVFVLEGNRCSVWHLQVTCRVVLMLPSPSRCPETRAASTLHSGQCEAFFCFVFNCDYKLKV